MSNLPKAVQCDDPQEKMPANSEVVDAKDRDGNDMTGKPLSDLREYGMRVTVRCKKGFLLSDNSLERNYECSAITTVGIWLMMEESTPSEGCLRKLHTDYRFYCGPNRLLFLIQPLISHNHSFLIFSLSIHLFSVTQSAAIIELFRVVVNFFDDFL